VEGKIKAIEDFDEKRRRNVLRGIDYLGPFRIAVLSDHPNPAGPQTHAGGPSPFAVLSSNRLENQDRGISFGEGAGRKANNLISPGICHGDIHRQLEKLVEKNPR